MRDAIASLPRERIQGRQAGSEFRETDSRWPVAKRRAERQQSFKGAWVARTVGSVVVVFELVAYGDDGNSRPVFDFEQRDVA
jgi:hypothetical protein